MANIKHSKVTTVQTFSCCDEQRKFSRYTSCNRQTPSGMCTLLSTCYMTT